MLKGFGRGRKKKGTQHDSYSVLDSLDLKNTNISLINKKKIEFQSTL